MPATMVAMCAEMHEKMMQKHEIMTQDPEGTGKMTMEEETRKEAEIAGSRNKQALLPRDKPIFPWLPSTAHGGHIGLFAHERRKQ